MYSSFRVGYSRKFPSWKFQQRNFQETRRPKVVQQKIGGACKLPKCFRRWNSCTPLIITSPFCYFANFTSSRQQTFEQTFEQTLEPGSWRLSMFAICSCWKAIGQLCASCNSLRSILLKTRSLQWKVFSGRESLRFPEVNLFSSFNCIMQIVLISECKIRRITRGDSLVLLNGMLCECTHIAGNQQKFLPWKFSQEFAWTLCFGRCPRAQSP